jgi:hypothetical protein
VAEKQVVLIAIAATPTPYELALEGGQIEFHGVPTQWVEIFEGDRLCVVEMERAQGVERCDTRAVRVADALEVGV